MIADIREVISKLKLMEAGVENALREAHTNVENLNKQIAELRSEIESKDKLIEELKRNDGEVHK